MPAFSPSLPGCVGGGSDQTPLGAQMSTDPELLADQQAGSGSEFSEKAQMLDDLVLVVQQFLACVDLEQILSTSGVLPDLDTSIDAPAMSDIESEHKWADDVRFLRNNLDPVSATAFSLIYEHHASQAQVGILLGLDERQLKSVVACALQQLAAALCPAPTLSPNRD